MSDPLFTYKQASDPLLMKIVITAAFILVVAHLNEVRLKPHFQGLHL